MNEKKETYSADKPSSVIVGLRAVPVEDHGMFLIMGNRNAHEAIAFHAQKYQNRADLLIAENGQFRRTGKSRPWSKGYLEICTRLVTAAIGDLANWVYEDGKNRAVFGYVDQIFSEVPDPVKTLQERDRIRSAPKKLTWHKALLWGVEPVLLCREVKTVWRYVPENGEWCLEPFYRYSISERQIKWNVDVR